MNEKLQKIVKLVAITISLSLLFAMAVFIMQYNNAKTDLNTEPIFINNTIKLKKHTPTKTPIKIFEEEVPPQSDVNVPEIG